MNGFRQSHAVVIGINGYGNGIPPLRTAVNDARRIAEILETEFGYAVQLLTEDVTLAKLSALLGEHLPIEVQADDRLLIYFAGHGIALDGDDGPAGYLVPQDARPDDRQSFLPMTDLSRWVERLPCRHLLLVLDCCFAGAFRWSSTRDLGALPEVIHKERFDRYIRDPAWQVITSAAYDQKALDVLAGDAIGVRAPDANNGEHSPFAAGFMRALQGEADLYPRAAPGRAGGDGVITATELYLFLRECVEVGAEDDGHRQTPGLWPLKRHDKGEYIHLIPGHELNLPPAPELNEANNPYRGLQSYDEEHAPVFFGRSQFVKKLAERVAEQPLTIVLGASGTGKSSVVKAGLLSYLRGTEPAAWQILPPIRPGKSPLASLASLTLPGQDTDDLGTRLAEFWTDPEALATRVGAWAACEPAGRLLLVVDQFEELITLCWDAGERDQFLRLLERALAAHADRLRVVLTLRSDFEPQFAHTPLQDRWISSRIVVPAMTLDEYREVIEGPASVKVLYFQGKASSQEFINRLIGDVANTPGALPLLSFTLSELYRRYLERGGDDRSLREDDYVALGGVGGSLRNRANEVYEGLPDDASRETMRRVMLRMISVEAGEVARRHVPDAELEYRDPAENARVADVLRRMTEARLVVEGKETDDQPYVEPAHDELVRGWDHLLGWARQDQEGLLLRRILTPAAEDWKRGHGGLWHANPRLSLVRRVLESPNGWLNRTEADFVELSIAKKRRVFVRTISAVSIAFVALSIITMIALHEWGRALEGEASAIKKERKAESRRLAVVSDAARLERLDLAMLLALEAAKQEDTLEARGSLQRSLDARPEVVRFLHVPEGYVNSVAFGLEGQIAAGYGVRGVGIGGVVLFDARGERLRPAPLEVPEGYVSSVAFGPEGQIAAGCGGGVVLFDARGERLRPAPLQGKESDVRSVAFGPEGQIAAGYAIGGMVLFDARGERLRPAPLQVKEGNVTSVAFGPEGQIAAGYGDFSVSIGGVELFDARGERLRPNPLVVKKGYVRSVAFGPEGQIAAGYGGGGGGGGSGVVLFDARGERLRPAPLQVKEGDVTSVAFGPEGNIAAGYSGGGGGGVVLFDARGERLRPAPLQVPECGVTSVAFGPEGKIAAGYCGGVGGVVLFDARGERLRPPPLEVKEDYVNSVAFGPEGQIAAGYAVDGGGGGVVLFDARGERLRPNPLVVKKDPVRSVAFGPEGKIAAGYGGVVVLFDARGERLRPTPLEVKESDVRSVAFGPEGQIAAGYIGAGGRSGVVLFDARGERLRPTPLEVKEGYVSSVAFGPEGQIAAGYSGSGGGGGGGVVLFDARGERLRPTPLEVKEGDVTSVAFGPGGKIAAGYGLDSVVSGGVSGGGVVLFDARGERLRPTPLEVKEGAVGSVAFGPEGKIAAGYGGGGRGGVVLYDARGERLRPAPLEVKEGKVWSVAFGPAGQIAAGYVGRDGGGVVLLDADPASWRRKAGQTANRNLTRLEWTRYFPETPYRRTICSLPWPVDLPDAERKQAEAFEKEHPEGSDAS